MMTKNQLPIIMDKVLLIVKFDIESLFKRQYVLEFIERFAECKEYIAYSQYITTVVLGTSIGKKTVSLEEYEELYRILPDLINSAMLISNEYLNKGWGISDIYRLNEKTSYILLSRLEDAF